MYQNMILFITGHYYGKNSFIKTSRREEDVPARIIRSDWDSSQHHQ